MGTLRPDIVFKGFYHHKRERLAKFQLGQEIKGMSNGESKIITIHQIPLIG